MGCVAVGHRAVFDDLLLASRNGLSRRLGRRSVRVGYCVLQVTDSMECIDYIERAYRGVDEGVAIECGA